jgi:hypothetical protein
MQFSEDAEPEELTAEQLVLKYLATLGKHAAFEETPPDGERPAEEGSANKEHIDAKEAEVRAKLKLKPKVGE